MNEDSRKNILALWAPKIYTPSGFARVDVTQGVRTLDIGCGGRKLPGAIGVDALHLPGVDVVHNLNIFPWPFVENSTALILANHFLEHAEDVVATMSEIHRILMPHGRVVIQVPYFRSIHAIVDPTHKHFFASQSLDYFISDTALSYYKYNDSLFLKKGFWYGWPHTSLHPVKRAGKSFMQRYPDFYDQYLSLLFPIECLTWELEAIK